MSEFLRWLFIKIVLFYFGTTMLGLFALVGAAYCLYRIIKCRRVS